MSLHQLLPLCALGLNLVLLGSALAPDRRSQRNYLFAYLAAALAVWNLGVFGLRSAGDAVTAMRWEYVLHVGVIPMPVLFYHYVLAFLELPRRRRPSLVAGYALCAFFLLANPTHLFMLGVRETYWGFVPVGGPLYTPLVIYFQAYLLLGFARVVYAYRTATSSFRRNRILLVLLGNIVGILGGLADFIRVITGLERLYPLGIPTNAVFALALGIAIVRYRLLDIGMVAKRVVLYLLTVASAGSLLAGGLYAIDRVTPGPHRFEVSLPYVFVLAVALGTILPALRVAERWFERLMFARQHGVRDALVALSKDMASVLDLHRLGQTLTEGLVSRVPVMHASLHLQMPGRVGFVPFSRATSDTLETPSVAVEVDGMLAAWIRLTHRPLVLEELVHQPATDVRLHPAIAALEAARVAVIVPLFLEGEIAAVLVVGEKVSGEVFGGAEIELLTGLVGQTAVALKNARLYEDLRNQMDALQRTQQQLIQSAKLAAIGELAASVAHEINNPLTVILGNSELLMNELQGNDRAQQRLVQMETEAMRAGKITRDLLDFARRREPKREPLALHDLVRRSVDLLGTRLGKGGIEVETRLDPEEPSILGDGDQLTQVFINLIANSVDAMSDSGTLSIRTEVRRDRGTVVITVADTGRGMAPDQLARIFEPFYTTKGDGRGTGLGLSVSLGIIKNHGGTLEAASEPGKGTMMFITLPLATRSRAGVAPAPMTESS
jgi:signal transduction histidine kinase